MSNALELAKLQDAIKDELKTCIGDSPDSIYREYFSIFDYQMGWEDPQKQTRGKRIRPMILLLAAHAVGGDWQKALPAAAALELMHNFSLIHDDIQDKSLQRRGKDTIWVKWGEALAINAGDAMLTLSSLAVHRLSRDYSDEIVGKVSILLQRACLELTKGQFLDISYEKLERASINEYFMMIGGKTCSLLEAALEIGAMLGGADHGKCELFRQCGFLLGEAYQVQDDWLGIWGDYALTGKSNESDLITRKKTYPILLGLSKKKKFFSLWSSRIEINSKNIHMLTEALEQDDVKKEAEAKSVELYENIFNLLDSTKCESDLIEPLGSVFKNLIKREI